MAQFESEGSIESRGRQGTFVATILPHQDRSALMLPFQPADAPMFTLFYQGLTAAANQLARALRELDVRARRTSCW